MLDKESYIKGKGLSCLFCEAESVQGGFIEIEAGKAFQQMGCTECDGTWQDVYKLSDVITYKEEE